MPSRQERRKAERDAAKRAPAQTTAANAASAAAALANANLNPLGDWTTQAEDPGALFQTFGADVVEQRAAHGDGEAQWSRGYRLLSRAGAAGTPMGLTRSTKADVGFALCIAQFPVAHQTEV
jgi:hypothetical protein